MTLAALLAGSLALFFNWSSLLRLWQVSHPFLIFVCYIFFLSFLYISVEVYPSTVLPLGSYTLIRHVGTQDPLVQR